MLQHVSHTSPQFIRGRGQRAAELLDLPWMDLRLRLARLGVPLRLGPESLEELRAEIEAMEELERR